MKLKALFTGKEIDKVHIIQLSQYNKTSFLVQIKFITEDSTKLYHELAEVPGVARDQM
jgi:hypothetical protein